jgi:hypothetical protein|tara:strand:+ start:481 stop:594 length:114 start_codon:yes stop_codon:yes gene_type:complete
MDNAVLGDDWLAACGTIKVELYGAFPASATCLHQEDT